MKISVCMATYNGEKYIKKQLDSILLQLNDNDELIISDDSSLDKTVEIIKLYNDKRIRLYENQSFKSPIYNFENALQKVKGDYVFLADQDDIWLPNKVITMKKYLKKYDLVVSDAHVVDTYENIIEQSFFQLNNSRRGLIKNIIKNSYLGCTMAFNKKILVQALPFPKNIPMHDWWIGLIGELFGQTYFVDQPLISYRRHGNNASPTGEKSKYFFKNKVMFRLKILKSLILKYSKNK